MRKLMTQKLVGQKLLAFGLAGLLGLQPAIAFAAPLDPGMANINASDAITPEQCQGITETELRPELTRTIQNFFENETAFDFEAEVAREWKLLKLDARIDSAVVQAVESIQADTKALDKFASSWSPAKAEQLAEQVIAVTFDNRELKRSLQKLSANVGNELSDQIELATVQSASYGMQCLQTFISGHYSQTFLDLFDAKADRSAQSGSNEFLAEFSPESRKYINSYGLAAGGVATIAVAQITRRVTKTMTKRVLAQVSERVLGRLGTTVVPVIGELVGGVLLVSDLAQSFSGSFDEIEAQIKSPGVKQTLRDRVAGAIAQSIGGESPQIAREIATELYANWLDFQKDYRETLTLANELPEFQQLVAHETNISRVTALVGIALDNMGRRNLIAAIQDGSFEQALDLPTVAQDIVRNTGSIAEAVAWYELAGNRIGDVVAMEMYKHLSRTGLDHRLLIQILNLDNPTVIAKLSLLGAKDIRRLLAIASPNLIQLGEAVSSQDLERLSGYIAGLKQADANDLIKFLLDGGSETIKNAEVMTHIVQSHDINVAIRFWQEQRSAWGLLQSGFLVAVGAIAWQLVLVKYGELYVGGVAFAIVITALLTLTLLLWLQRQINSLRQKRPQLNASDK